MSTTQIPNQEKISSLRSLTRRVILELNEGKSTGLLGRLFEELTLNWTSNELAEFRQSYESKTKGLANPVYSKTWQEAVDSIEKSTYYFELLRIGKPNLKPVVLGSLLRFYTRLIVTETIHLDEVNNYCQSP